MSTILITGATGLIGNHLRQRLEAGGHKILQLNRQKSGLKADNVFYWDPEKNYIDGEAIRNADYIIHLAGTNIGSDRWTPERKKSIVFSRLNTCRLLFEEVRKNSTPLKAFISASGVGYYGAVTTNHIFEESDPPGCDFLADTCRRWEDAATSFAGLGIRTVILRNGVVLAKGGGIIQRLRFSFRAGLGVVFGRGSQYMPWIHIDDLCKMYIMAVENGEMSGVYNAVAPEFLTFSDFAHQYASSLNRKIILPSIPPLVLKLALGEMSMIVLEGSRISCRKILDTGFIFKYNSLLPALEDLFKTQQ